MGKMMVKFMLNSSNFSKSHLTVNFPVGEPAIGELGVGELSVGEQSATRLLFPGLL
jgi:hypothetical protein